MEAGMDFYQDSLPENSAIKILVSRLQPCLVYSKENQYELENRGLSRLPYFGVPGRYFRPKVLRDMYHQTDKDRIANCSTKQVYDLDILRDSISLLAYDIERENSLVIKRL